MPLYYQNDKLFSEIYLEEITAQPEREEVLASLRVLREYRDYAETDNLNAWVTSYIHEVLAALGFNPVLKTDALTLLNPMGTLDHPVSLCYVTLPEEDLDNTTMGHNWAEKVIRSLREHEMQWGLLTNGKLWRIYHLDEPMPYETYFEIDLDTILTDQAKKAYQIFHKFMKAENFLVDEENQSQFDRFKKESKDKVDYIENELQNALKQREEGGQGVLSDICMGYVEELRNAGDVNLDDEDMRQKIYHGAMLYMFRLLFLFYADARGLLKDDNHNLLGKIYQIAGNEKLGPDTYSLWGKLSAIFVDIDQTYNGGLFSPQESEFTQFIEETRIKDQYLSPVFYNLTTYKEKDGKDHLISYRDMGVRHLGTLYEGLLEHKLFIAPEDTEVKVTKGKVSFIPVSKGGKLVVGQYLPAGSVYFAGDPSERKSTGSYYTPEFIVDYIVQSTVGEKLSELKSKFLEGEKANLKALNMAINEEERQALADLLEENSLRFVREEVLNLSVLDPAMGSGHFLVNATNLISNTITELLNDLGIEGGAPTGTGYWRRWVVENCIYGVDINPLAVELAKLSLWILSMAKNQPLSFMNHHLKCGNSLVGARLDEIGNYPPTTKENPEEQISLFDRDPEFKSAVGQAISRARLITERESSLLSDVQDKRIWLDEVQEILGGYKNICNLHTILCSEKVISEEDYKKIISNKDFAKAARWADSSDYFHWELEYPEIFYRNDGFDIVVTNPPYLGEKGNVDYFKMISQGALGEYYYGKMDLFYFFFHLALDITKPTALIALITTNYFITATAAKKLRYDLKERSKIRKLINFNELKIFDSATGQHNMISVIEKVSETNPKATLVNTHNKGVATREIFKNIVQGEDNRTEYNSVLQEKIFDGEEYYIRFGTSHQIEMLLDKIKQTGIPLGDICNVNVGFATGADKVSKRHTTKFDITVQEGEGIFILTREEVKKLNLTNGNFTLIKPCYKNSDISPWVTKDYSDKVVIYIHRQVTELPNQILKHLEKYKTILENRFVVLDNRIKWWELQEPRDRNIFIGEKIVTPQRSTRNSFAYTDTDFHASSDVYFIKPKESTPLPKYILAILNSKLIYTWLYHRGKRKGETLELYGTPLKEIPVKSIPKSKQLPFITLVDSIRELIKSNETPGTKAQQARFEKQIDRLVYDLYDLSDQERELVENFKSG